MIVGVYKITNPLGEVYIGQSQNVEERFISHKNQPANHNLYNSFFKHGAENHSFEVIEECDYTLLRERELFHYNRLKSEGISLMNVVINKSFNVKKSKNEKRLFITIPVDNETYYAIKNKSELSGRTITDYVRRKALGLD